MFKLLVFALCSACLWGSLYSIEVRSLRGEAIDFRAYRGKKILIVNTATKSPLAPRQLSELELLQDRYKDSLVVVAVPSNSFGGERGSVEEILRQMQGRYGAHYLITEQMEVRSGAGQSPLYGWLSQKAQNGVMDSEVSGDFQKYLIGPEGQLLGFFVGAITPMDSLVLKTIEGRWKAPR